MTRDRRQRRNWNWRLAVGDCDPVIYSPDAAAPCLQRRHLLRTFWSVSCGNLYGRRFLGDISFVVSNFVFHSCVRHKSRLYWSTMLRGTVTVCHPIRRPVWKSHSTTIMPANHYHCGMSLYWDIENYCFRHLYFSDLNPKQTFTVSPIFVYCRLVKFLCRRTIHISGTHNVLNFQLSSPMSSGLYIYVFIHQKNCAEYWLVSAQTLHRLSLQLLHDKRIGIIFYASNIVDSTLRVNDVWRRHNCHRVAVRNLRDRHVSSCRWR